jgi:predicted ferric reductase
MLANVSVGMSAGRAYAPAGRWRRDAIGLVVWASLLIVVALWVSNQGLQDLARFPDLLSSVGRLAGLMAADLLLIQVFLIARVPWVERTYGQDELVRLHRLVGFTSFNLLLVHIVTIVFGYAGTSHTGVLAEVWQMLTTFPGLLLAAAGAGLLTLVVVTSVRVARRRMRYESWHLLHLYAYLGVGLALPHQIWTGTDFTGSAWAATYWWSAYISAAGAVVVFRFGLPLWRSLRHRLVVEEVVPEADGVVSVYLRGRRLDRLPVRAGQFFVWRFLDRPGWTRGHPYSLSAAPRPDRLRITVQGGLDSVQPGTRVLIEGPYGRLTGEVRRRPELTMIASGIGITPLRALLEELDYEPGRAVLIYRAHSPEDLVFRQELDKLAARRGIGLVYLPGPRVPDRVSWQSAPYAHVADDVGLRQIVPRLLANDVYVCGPAQWMEAVRKAALRAGVPAEHIHAERFSW